MTLGVGNPDTERLTYEPLARAAARTGLSVQDLWRCIATGRLNAYRCGSRIVRVDPRDVDLLKADTLLMPKEADRTSRDRECTVVVEKPAPCSTDRPIEPEQDAVCASVEGSFGWRTTQG